MDKFKVNEHHYILEAIIGNVSVKRENKLDSDCDEEPWTTIGTSEECNDNTCTADPENLLPEKRYQVPIKEQKINKNSENLGPVRIVLKFLNLATLDIEENEFKSESILKKEKQLFEEKLKKEESKDKLEAESAVLEARIAEDERKAKNEGVSVEKWKEDNENRKKLISEIGSTLPASPRYTTGKNCLFSSAPSNLIQAIKSEKCEIILYRLTNEQNIAYEIGRSKIQLNRNFIETVTISATNVVLPVSVSIENEYSLQNIVDETTAKVKIFLRLGCFGSSFINKIEKIEQVEEQHIFEPCYATEVEFPTTIKTMNDLFKLPVPWKRFGDVKYDVKEPFISLPERVFDCALAKQIQSHTIEIKPEHKNCGDCKMKCKFDKSNLPECTIAFDQNKTRIANAPAFNKTASRRFSAECGKCPASGTNCFCLNQNNSDPVPPPSTPVGIKCPLVAAKCPFTTMQNSEIFTNQPNILPYEAAFSKPTTVTALCTCPKVPDFLVTSMVTPKGGHIKCDCANYLTSVGGNVAKYSDTVKGPIAPVPINIELPSPPEEVLDLVKSKSEIEVSKPIKKPGQETAEKMLEEELNLFEKQEIKEIKLKKKKKKKEESRKGSDTIFVGKSDYNEVARSDGNELEIQSEKSFYIYTAGHYPGIHIGHKECIVPYKIVPKNMGWLWNLKSISGYIKPSKGWRPGNIPDNISELMSIAKHKTKTKSSVKKKNQPKKAKDVRALRSEAGGDSAKGPSKCLKERKQKPPPDPSKFKPSIHLHKKHGIYYITMYPTSFADKNRKKVMRKNAAGDTYFASTSEEDIILEPKHFRIDPKHPDGSNGSSSSGASSTTSTEDSFELEFVAPSMLKTRLPPKNKKDMACQVSEDRLHPLSDQKKVSIQSKKSRKSRKSRRSRSKSRKSRSKSTKNKGKGKGKKGKK